MADDIPEIRAAPRPFKSNVWRNFGFHNLSGNTTNVSALIAQHHPELHKVAEKTKPVASNQQRTLDTLKSEHDS